MVVLKVSDEQSHLDPNGLGLSKLNEHKISYACVRPINPVKLNRKKKIKIAISYFRVCMFGLSSKSKITINE